MGCLFAGMLGRAGHEVALLEQDPERARAIAASGISIEQGDGKMLAGTPAVYCTLSRQVRADLVVLFVKSYDTQQAAERCLPAVGQGTTVLTLQNGLGNIEAIERHVPKAQLLAGTTAQGSTLLGHGRVRHAGRGQTVIGSFSAEGSGRARDVRDFFESAGIESVVSEDIQSVLWGKLLVNAGINALTAIMDTPNGSLVRDDHLRAVMRRAVLEGAALARRLDIPLPYADPAGRADEVCRATADNISSMLQDRRSGRRTEIESINGALVDYGRRLGIPMPVNSFLTSLVRSFTPGGPL